MFDSGDLDKQPERGVRVMVESKRSDQYCDCHWKFKDDFLDVWGGLVLFSRGDNSELPR